MIKDCDSNREGIDRLRLSPKLPLYLGSLQTSWQMLHIPKTVDIKMIEECLQRSSRQI